MNELSTWDLWGPQVVGAGAGALIGALAAGGIAWWLTHRQLDAEKRHALEATRRSAFGDFLSALGRLGESIRWDEERMRAAHLEAVRTHQVWSMHLAANDRDVGEWVFAIEGRIIEEMKHVFRRNPGVSASNDRLIAFFADSEGERLFTGLHNHGVEWHREGGDVTTAREWLKTEGNHKSDENEDPK